MHTRSYLRRAASALGAAVLATVALTAGGAGAAFADSTTTTADPAATTTAAPTTTTAAPTTTVDQGATTTTAAQSTTTTTGSTTTTTSVKPNVGAAVAAPVADPNAALALVTGSDPATGVGPLHITFSTAGTVANTGDTYTYGFDPQDGSAGDVTPTGTAVTLPATLGPFTYSAVGSFTATLTVTDATQNITSVAHVVINVEQLAPDAAVSTGADQPGVIVCANATATTCTMDLYAKTGGTASAGEDSFPIWGFTTDPAATPVLPGARLVATAGQTLTLNFHNVDIPDPVSLEVPAIAGSPDNVGVTHSNSKTYTFKLDRPGTFIVEAGGECNDQTCSSLDLSSTGAREVAMGLATELIVRPPIASPSAKYAYNNGSSFDSYDVEANVVLQEFDPEFNKDPQGQDLGEYSPTAFFMNGHAFDATAALDPNAIHVGPGNTLLLRYLNLGLRERNMRLINVKQTQVARDSYILADPKTGVANPITESGTWLTAGQASDSFVTVPPVLPVNGTPVSYPLYDGGFHLNNGGADGLGGIYTSIVADLPPAGQTVAVGNLGPIATCGNPPVSGCSQPVMIQSSDANAPAISTSGADLTVTARFQAQGGNNVASAKWFLDTLEPTIGGLANGLPVTPTAGAFGDPADTVTFTVPWQDLMPRLAATPGGAFGDHIIWVQATDSANNVGTAAGDVVTLPMKDPIVTALTLSPNVTNTTTGSTIAQTPTGAIAVNGTATASLPRYGIIAAEACVLGPSLVPPSAATVNSTCHADGSGLPLDVTPNDASAPVSAISGNFVPPTADGKYWVFVHAEEQLFGDTTNATNRWSPYAYDDGTGAPVGDTYQLLQVVAAGSVPPGTSSAGLPTVSGLALDPNPNNGTVSTAGNQGLFNSLLLTGTANAPASNGAQANIALAEAFVAVPGQVGPPAICTSQNTPTGCATAWGTGLEAIPANGVWGDTSTKPFSAYVPLPIFNVYTLTQPVPVWVHAKDTAGNWGPFTEVDLQLDLTLPTVDSFTISNLGLATVKAHDPAGGPTNIATGIVAAQRIVNGTATALNITHTLGTSQATITFNLPLNQVPHGTSVSVQVQDAAGNWSTIVTRVRP